MVDPVQNLGDSFFCSIEKVFLCTGADGYVPKYNPTKFEFGCLADSPSLLYRFKVLVSIFFFFYSFYFSNVTEEARTLLEIIYSCLDVTRTKLSQRLRHVCLVMSVLMLCWQWMIPQPCPWSDSRGLTASDWTLQLCSRYLLKTSDLL